MTTKPRNAALYLRLSDTDKDPDTGLLDTSAVDRQRVECRAWADRNGWAISDEYADNNVSATKDKARPAYDAMLAAVVRGDHDGVLVWNLDRLSRRLVDRLTFRELATSHGVRLATKDYELDLASIDGQMMFLINGVVAEAEIRRKDERQASEIAAMIRRGDEYPGGKRPFGFKKRTYAERGRRVVRYRDHEPKEADAIRHAASEYLSGRSWLSICREFNEAGILSSGGFKWGSTELKNVVTNPRTAGLLVHQGEVIGPAKWEPILDRETWETVRAVAASRKVNRFGPERSHFLSGITRCGVCGDPIVGSYVRSIDRNVLFCKRRHMQQKMEPVDARVTDVVLTALRHRAQAPWVYAHTPADADTLHDLLGQTAALNERKRELAAAYAADVIDMGQLTTATTALNARLADLEARRATLHRASVLPDLLPEDDVRAVWDGMDADRRRAIIAELVVPVVSPPGKGARKFNPDTITFDWRGRPPHVVVSCDHRPDVAVIRETNDDGTVRGWAPVAMTYNPITQTVTWDEPPTDPCCIPSDADLDDAVLHGRLVL